MNCQLISTIADCITALVALTAFVVAWLTYHKEYAIKLKIEVSDEPKKIASPKQNQGDYGFIVRVINQNNRPVTILDAWLTVSSSKNYITSAGLYETKRLDIADIYTAPLIIPPENLICELWVEGKPNEKEKLLKERVIIRLETTCGTYIRKTSTTVGDLLKIRQQQIGPVPIVDSKKKYSKLMRAIGEGK